MGPHDGSWSPEELARLDEAFQSSELGRAAVAEAEGFAAKWRERETSRRAIDRAVRRKSAITKSGNEHPGFVYFIEAIGTGRVKIGWSKRDVNRRLGELAVASPFSLQLLGLMTGGKLEERATHARFKASRVPGKREWFFDSPELRSFIVRRSGK